MVVCKQGAGYHSDHDFRPSPANGKGRCFRSAEARRHREKATASMNIAQIAFLLQVILAFMGAYLVAFWFAMVIWTYYDIRARSQDTYVYVFATALVLVFHVFGLLLYYILRPRETLAEAYERSLEEEALLREMDARHVCPSCQQRVEQDFLLCPHCRQQLKRKCAQCDHMLDLNWDICPYCGRTPDTGPQTEPRRPVSAESEQSGQRVG